MPDDFCREGKMSGHGRVKGLYVIGFGEFEIAFYKLRRKSTN